MRVRGGIGAAGQDDRQPGAQHDARAVGAVKKSQLLGQHVAGFQVRHQQDVGLAGDRRDDALGRGRPPG